MLNHMQNAVKHWGTRFKRGRGSSVHIPASGHIIKSRRSSLTLIVYVCMKLYHANIPGPFKHHLPLSNVLCNRHKATSKKLNRCYGVVWKVTSRSWATIIQILGASNLSTLSCYLKILHGCLKCVWVRGWPAIDCCWQRVKVCWGKMKKLHKKNVGSASKTQKTQDTLAFVNNLAHLLQALRHNQWVQMAIHIGDMCRYTISTGAGYSTWTRWTVAAVCLHTFLNFYLHTWGRWDIWRMCIYIGFTTTYI